MSQSPPEGLLERVRAEYLEMPGLRLSIDQLQRLCGVEPTLCQLVLDMLVDAKFLSLKVRRCLREVDGRRGSPSTRSEGGPATRLRAAAAVPCVLRQSSEDEAEPLRLTHELDERPACNRVVAVQKSRIGMPANSHRRRDVICRTAILPLLFGAVPLVPHSASAEANTTRSTLDSGLRASSFATRLSRW